MSETRIDFSSANLDYTSNVNCEADLAKLYEQAQTTLEVATQKKKTTEKALEEAKKEADTKAATDSGVLATKTTEESEARTLLTEVEQIRDKATQERLTKADEKIKELENQLAVDQSDFNKADENFNSATDALLRSVVFEDEAPSLIPLDEDKKEESDTSGDQEYVKSESLVHENCICIGGESYCSVPGDGNFVCGNCCY
jgi:hypothetical protein